MVADYTTPAHPRFVAGSIGPGTKLPSLGHISFKDLHAIYRRQVSGLIDGGADLLIIETCQDLLQTKATLIAIFDEFKAKGLRLPVIVQVTMENTGAMLLGSDMLTAIITLSPFPLDVLGLNCATGPKAMGAHVRTLSSSWKRPISVIPNAGLPQNIDGQMVYDLTPNELAHDLHHFVTGLGVNIVGGCCGTTPEHLKAVVDMIGGLTAQPRTTGREAAASSLSGVAASAVDPLLRALAAGGDASALDLLGTAAVANARAAYALFKTEFGGERFASLRAKGARVQRPLWASTSTKDPAYSDTMYVDSLIGPDTVNTMPPQTLDAVLDQGVVAPALDGTGPSAEQTLDALTAAGINMAEVTEKLLRDGVAAFADSYDAVLASVESKCGELAQAAS